MYRRHRRPSTDLFVPNKDAVYNGQSSVGKIAGYIRDYSGPLKHDNRNNGVTVERWVHSKGLPPFDKIGKSFIACSTSEEALKVLSDRHPSASCGTFSTTRVLRTSDESIYVFSVPVIPREAISAVAKHSDKLVEWRATNGPPLCDYVQKHGTVLVPQVLVDLLDNQAPESYSSTALSSETELYRVTYAPAIGSRVATAGQTRDRQAALGRLYCLWAYEVRQHRHDTLTQLMTFLHAITACSINTPTSNKDAPIPRYYDETTLIHAGRTGRIECRNSYYGYKRRCACNDDKQRSHYDDHYSALISTAILATAFVKNALRLQSSYPRFIAAVLARPESAVPSIADITADEMTQISADRRWYQKLVTTLSLANKGALATYNATFKGQEVKRATINNYAVEPYGGSLTAIMKSIDAQMDATYNMAIIDAQIAFARKLPDRHKEIYEKRRVRIRSDLTQVRSESDSDPEIEYEDDSE